MAINNEPVKSKDEVINYGFTGIEQESSSGQSSPSKSTNGSSTSDSALSLQKSHEILDTSKERETWSHKMDFFFAVKF